MIEFRSHSSLDELVGNFFCFPSGSDADVPAPSASSSFSLFTLRNFEPALERISLIRLSHELPPPVDVVCLLAAEPVAECPAPSEPPSFAIAFDVRLNLNVFISFMSNSLIWFFSIGFKGIFSSFAGGFRTSDWLKDRRGGGGGGGGGPEDWAGEKKGGGGGGGGGGAVDDVKNSGGGGGGGGGGRGGGGTEFRSSDTESGDVFPWLPNRISNVVFCALLIDKDDDDVLVVFWPKLGGNMRCLLLGTYGFLAGLVMDLSNEIVDDVIRFELVEASDSFDENKAFLEFF